jgi:hypothetical protein
VTQAVLTAVGSVALVAWGLYWGLAGLFVAAYYTKRAFER